MAVAGLFRARVIFRGGEMAQRPSIRRPFPSYNPLQISGHERTILLIRPFVRRSSLKAIRRDPVRFRVLHSRG